MTTQHLSGAGAPPEWAKVTDGNVIVYLYVHPDPVVRDRYSIQREFVEGRKAPYFNIHDTVGKMSGSYERLGKAKEAVEKGIAWEAANPDVRTSIANDIASRNMLKAFTRLLDYVNERNDELRDAVDRDFDELRGSLRNI